MKFKLLGVLFAVFMLSSCSAENVLTDIPGTIDNLITSISS